MNTINHLTIAGMLVLASCTHSETTLVADSNGKVNVETEQGTTYSGLVQSNYSGVVEAQKTTALSFATMGTVTEIFVEEGQEVRKGQLLAKVDAFTAQNAYQAALAKQQ